MMLNILSEEFQKKLVDSIISIVEKAIERILESKLTNERYLREEEARKYAAKISFTTFQRWQDEGINPIVIKGVTCYDRQDIDEFMKKHKLSK